MCDELKGTPGRGLIFYPLMSGEGRALGWLLLEDGDVQKIAMMVKVLALMTREEWRVVA